MNLIKRTFLILCLLLQAGTFAGNAQNISEEGFLKELINQFHFIEQRLTSLADAVPVEKYNWRPADGIRSIGEVYRHAVTANYYLLSFAGAALPEGFNPDYEKAETDKQDILKSLKKSYEHVRNFISTMKPEDLDKEVELPFGRFSQRGLLFIVLNHGHEHLGQSIAYARSNGVKPPWSE